MIEGTSMDLSDRDNPETLKLRAAPSTGGGLARGSVMTSTSRGTKSAADGGGSVAATSGLPKKKTPMQLVDEKMVDDNVKATVALKYAFGGSSASMNDGLATFALASSADKERNDRLLYRVGRQVVVVDPETGAQQFFTGRARNVTVVLHFTVAPNQRHAAMCESTLSAEASVGGSGAGGHGSVAGNGSGTALLSVYSLHHMTKVKTLTHPCAADFICSTFCTDQKMIAALTGDVDRQIVVWQWDKDKIIKTCQVRPPITSVR
jgi:hypothetical protein